MVRQYLYPTYGDAVYTQGFKVYTTIDSKLQQAAYAALRKGILNYDASKGYQGAEQQLNLNDTSGDNTPPDQVALGLFDGVADYGNLLGAIVLGVNDNEIDAILRNGNRLQFTDHQLDWVRRYIDGGGNKQIKVGSVIRVYQTNNQWQISQIPQIQGALVAMDPNNGAIKALMGGFDFGLSSFNHVMQASRQPGSSFKPFIYSSALDKGYTTETTLNDSSTCFAGGNNGQQWCPKDDDNKFLGPISFRQALTLSRNLATINMLNDITPQYAIQYVSKFGFAESQFPPYLTMALGAVEQTPIQMAQAYGVFANGGYLVEPYFISKITDANGKVLAETRPDNIRQQQPVIDPRNAFIMNSVLQDVAKYGTGARAYQALHRDDVGGKTGTTNDAKDVWFDGYTPDLVAITWVGYDQPKTLGRQFGSTLALPIWIDFMKVALANLPVRQLAMPDGIVSQAGGTWKGGTEYYYAGSVIGKEDASGEFATESNPDASAPVIQEPGNNNASGAATDNSAKPDDINDIIKNIQD
jgi:penicillin-binding protein 1A